MAMLSNHAYASETLFDKLIEKGYPESESADAVAWLTGLGYLDDTAYTESVIRSQRAKGYGPRRISMYLQAHGISREAADEALESAFGGEGACERTAGAIDAFLAKRAGSSPDRAEREKLAAALARRGFEYADIRAGFDRLEERSPRE